MKKNGKLSAKLLIYILCVTTVILALMAFVFFFFYRNQMKEKYRKLTYNTLSNVDVVFNGYVNNASNMAIQFYQSPEGILCRYTSDYKIGENMNFILNIQDMISHTPYIQSVAFVNRERKLSLSVNSGISYIADFEKQMEEMHVTQRGKRILVWSAQDYYEEETYVPILSCIYSDMSAWGMGYEGMVAINIDRREMSKNLLSSRSEIETTIFIMDSVGNVVAHSDEMICGETWTDQEMVKSILKGKNQFDIVLDSFRYEINWINSQQKNFYIVAQTRFNNDGGEVILLLILLLTFVFFVIFFSLIIHKTLNPLTNVVVDMSTKSFDIIEFCDEVDFLRRYHVGMNEQIESLNRQLYKNLVIRNLIVGAGREVVWSMLEEAKIISPEKKCFFIMLYIQKNADKKESITDYMEIKDRIIRICGFALAEMGGSEYFDISLRRILFLLSEDKNSDFRMLQKLLEEKKQEIERSTRDFTVFIFLSEEVTKEKDICQIYRYMNGCLQTRLLLDDVQAVTAVSTEPLRNSIDSKIKEMVQAVVRREYDRYLAIIEELLSEYRDVPYERFCDMLMEIWRAVDNINVENMSKEEKSKYQENARRQILRLRSRKELLDWFEKLYHATERNITRINKHSADAILVDVVEYIQNNYSEYRLNVSYLAEQMNLSVQHFSRIFKEFTGDTVLEYITKVRMEKAREMLILCPDMDMTEMAEKLGYGNGAYFAQVFKKHYGISPSKYRDYYVAYKLKDDKSQ